MNNVALPAVDTSPGAVDKRRPLTPLFAVDIAAIYYYDDIRKVVLIERANTPMGTAFPGGLVDCGETIKEAAIREFKEETGLDLAAPTLLQIFDRPDRDPRDHVVSFLFVGYAVGTPKAGSDAKTVKLVDYADLMKENFVFDHAELAEYFLKYGLITTGNGWNDRNR